MTFGRKNLAGAAALFLALSYATGLAVGYFSQEADYTDIYFCPESDCSEKVISLIDSARRSIDIAVLIFSHGNISDALIRARERGVDVRVLFDASWAKGPLSVDEILARAGVGVRYDSNPAEMHNKILVVDDRIVATGSFDYALTSAIANNETLIVMRSPREARSFREKVDSLWEAGSR